MSADACQRCGRPLWYGKCQVCQRDMDEAAALLEWSRSLDSHRLTYAEWLQRVRRVAA